MGGMYSSQFPNQKLTTREKIERYGSIEKWGQFMIDTVLQLAGQFHYSSMSRRYLKQVNYNLYHGIITKEDYKYVIEPYGMQDFEFPATLQHFDLISPKVNLLLGEEAKRPFNFTVVGVNPGMTTEIATKKKEAFLSLAQQLLQGAMDTTGLGGQGPLPDESGQAPPPQEIPKSLQDLERYFKYEYRDMRETAAQEALNFLVRYNNIRDVFNRGWFDLLITGEEAYWVGVVNNEPVMRNVNPLYFEYDISPDTEWIEDSAWAMEIRYLTAADVYDEFHEVLSDDQVQKIEEIKGGYTGRLMADAGFNVPIVYETGIHTQSPMYYRMNSTTLLKVVHMEWKSLRKVGFLTVIDEMGQEQVTMVDDTFKLPQELRKTGAILEWRWLNEVWEATKIGDEIYVNVQPKPNQFKNMDNPSECKLGYVGLVFNNRNSKPYSLVEVMKPIQYLYNIMMYRLELEIARAKGKKMIFDIAQIPKSQGWNVEKWMYYFDVLGIAFINSFEEGKTHNGYQLPQFNQFTQIDLSLGQTINQYVAILEKLEDMLGELTGITRQRQGQVSPSELVGTTQAAVMQSANITEHLFDKHNTLKKRVLENLLNTAKLAWISGKKFQYVADDFARKFYEIDGIEFNDAEYGVFVSSSIRDLQMLETMRQMATSAVQSQQASLLDAISILEANSIAQAKKILEGAIEKSEALRQQQFQEQLQQQQQQAEAEIQRQREKLEFDKYKVDSTNETKIRVAELTAYSFNPEVDINQNQIPDPLELEKIRNKATEAANKLGLEREKLMTQKEEKRIDREHEDKLAKQEASLREKEIAAKKAAQSKKPKK